MAAIAAPVLKDLEWALGDALIKAEAVEERSGAAKAEAARVTRREPADLTWIARTCEAFPLGRRRVDAPFALHRAVLDLEDAERGSMLVTAIDEGWSVRRTGRAVLEARITAGRYCPPVDDDLDDKLYRRIVQAWNRATPGARDLFLGSAEEANMADIML